MIILKTRYGTKVEYVSEDDIYAIVKYNDTKVRVLKEDFDEESQKLIKNNESNETKALL